MMMKVNKKPLDLKLYSKYEIDQRYSAFVIELNDLNEKEVEDIEYEYQRRGYQIFSSELNRKKNGLLSMTLILAKLNFVF